MSELVGVIISVKDFLSNLKTKLTISIGTDKQDVQSLKEDRKYIVPDFQREIRWTVENVDVLIEDIKSGPKFLGNVILAKCGEKDFAIIDGQQRITILIMIVHCLKGRHKETVEIFDPCALTVESFAMFQEFMGVDFDDSKLDEDALKQADKLGQRARYKDLYEHISTLPEITNKREAAKLIANIEKSQFNIILNNSADLGDSIHYFIDVNLKGEQLDDEDIFKSYLFKNDSSEEIRKQWYKLKTLTARLEGYKVDFSLLRILEYYFLCDLYNHDEYKGIEFGSNFLLKKEFVDADGNKLRKGTHLIECIKNKRYMFVSLERINSVVSVMADIADSESPSTEFKSLFTGTMANKKADRVDDIEQKVIHTLIRTVLKDKLALPKAMLMKYFLVIIYGDGQSTKQKIQNIYAVYLFVVLFIVFENKKSKEALMKIVHAEENQWYVELMNQINEYFDINNIINARLEAQYKLSRNEDEEEYDHRCRALATVYNFFEQKDDRIQIKKSSMNKLKSFLDDSDMFSTEHFIISNSKGKKLAVEVGDYKMDASIYRKYVRNLFNFIFIPRSLNDTLDNNWLPVKERILQEQISQDKKSQDKKITCEYSKMIIDKAQDLLISFPNLQVDNYEEELNEFFSGKFQEAYLEYAQNVLIEVIVKIHGKKE